MFQLIKLKQSSVFLHKKIYKKFNITHNAYSFVKVLKNQIFCLHYV